MSATLLESISQAGEKVVHTWSERDVLLYNMSVGAGQDDATAELNLTTENSPEATLRVLPTFACTLASAPWPAEFAPDMTSVVHVDEAITIEAPLPTSGSCSAQMTVKETSGHRAGTVFHLESTVTDLSTEKVLARVRMGLLVRGMEHQPTDQGAGEWNVDGEPMMTLDVQTVGNQALWYRLNGDRNPLHSSPAFARRAGFDRPILHGLCTLGLSTRVLAGTFSPEDPALITGISGSFRKPVFPGDRLRVQAWEQGQSIFFRTLNEDGKTVLDHGRLDRTP